VIELNLKEMAGVLSVSVPTLAALVRRSPGFPVLQHGSKDRPWKFDPEAVIAFIQAKDQAAEAIIRERSQKLAEVLARPANEPRPRMSLDDELKVMKIRALEREEAKETRLLVPAGKVMQALEWVLTIWKSTADDRIHRTVAAHNLPDAVAVDFMRYLDESSSSFMREVDGVLRNPVQDTLF
jgi:phage terminase Nu1 subunit (DNA packaging protein)